MKDLVDDLNGSIGKKLEYFQDMSEEYDDYEGEEEEEENAIATASEYIFVTRGGRIASITDLSIGIGLQLFESE